MRVTAQPLLCLADLVVYKRRAELTGCLHLQDWVLQSPASRPETGVNHQSMKFKDCEFLQRPSAIVEHIVGVILLLLDRPKSDY